MKARDWLILGLTCSCSAPALAQDEPAPVPPHYAMEYGAVLCGTIDDALSEANTTLKGVAIRLGADDDGAVLFDTELLRVSAGWVDGFLELRGTPYDGSHGPVPKVRGRQLFMTGPRPGWAMAGSFADPRPIPFGTLPTAWGRYQGFYLHGDQVVLSYRVGDCNVLEQPSLVRAGDVAAIARTLNLGASSQTQTMLVCERGGATAGMREGLATLRREWPEGKFTVTAVALVGAPAGVTLRPGDGASVLLDVPPHSAPLRCKVVVWDGPANDLDRFATAAKSVRGADDLSSLTTGGATRWRPLTTHGELGADDGPYAVDTIAVPEDNPWHSRLRFAAFDFFSDGRAALSTWNGDVWIVSGLDEDFDDLRWTRFASGLFDPLGLKIVGDVVHTLGRDQITRLHDLNGDGEADFYENFNNQVLITRSFHEFAFDLQTDPEGNFYFSKGGPVRPGGRGFDQLVPHHGCILKVAKDGSELEVYATGLRAPNGIGVSPTGIVTSGDNEGTWMPRCRLNWIERGAFLGCVDTAHREQPPTTYDDPLCFMPMEVDNSGGGQVWVTSDRWGPFQGELLHLSYGQCELYEVLRQQDGKRIQAGVTRFPISFASSAMRGRFNPRDGQLYICGFQGWQTRAARMTAFQRVRYTGDKVYMPRGMQVRRDGVAITFTEPLDAATATDVENFNVEQWNYLWTERYGSPEVSAIAPEIDREKIGDDNWTSYKRHDPVKVDRVELEDDGRTVFLHIAGLRRVMQMRIQFNLDAADGALVKGEIHNTINWVPEH